MDLSVQIAPRHHRGLLLKNPVMTSSGTFGYGTEYVDLVDIGRLGAIVSKGITARPRVGNPQPRLVETVAGVLNSVGLENIGVEAVLRDKVSVWATWEVPVIVNVAGETIDDYVEVARRLEGVLGVGALELNVSCPNVPAGGMEFGISPEPAFRLTSAVRKASSLPLIVKLTPNAANIVEVALAIQDAGADAVCLINTVPAMAIDVETGEPSLGSTIGGLSGPAIKPIALYLVYHVARAVQIPVVGCGGILSGRDAVEFLLAGASAVQVGSANLADPWAALRVIDSLRQYMRSKGVTQLADLIGRTRSRTEG